MGEFQDLDRTANTMSRYSEALENCVTALDRFLKAIRTNTRDPTAKVCKTVLSSILGVAARHGALEGNPLRYVVPIPVNKTEVRALTVSEDVALRAGLDQWQNTLPKSGKQRPQDLLDVVDIMLATGCRIGEAMIDGVVRRTRSDACLKAV